MRKLTKEESKIVEDNHNLIYGFIQSKGLDVNIYYGLIAESLCKSAMIWDKSKGEISTIFYKIANNDLYREWRKNNAQKRQHGGLLELEEWVESDYSLEEEVVGNSLCEEILSSENGQVVKLRLEGYTQEEIALKLGKNQPQISKILKKVGEEYL